MLAGAIENVAVPAATGMLADRVTPLSEAVTVAVPALALQSASIWKVPEVRPAEIAKASEDVSDPQLESQKLAAPEAVIDTETPSAGAGPLSISVPEKKSPALWPAGSVTLKGLIGSTERTAVTLPPA